MNIGGLRMAWLTWLWGLGRLSLRRLKRLGLLLWTRNRSQATNRRPHLVFTLEKSPSLDVIIIIACCCYPLPRRRSRAFFSQSKKFIT